MVSFFRRPLDEAEKHHRKALRFRDHTKKDFDFGLSIWHFKQAIRLKPNNPVYHYYLGRAYAAAPMLAVVRDFNAAFKLKDSASLAIAELKEAIRLRPNFPEAYMVLGEVYMYLGETDKALRAFQAVQALSDDKKLLSYVRQDRRQAEQGISEHPQPDKAREHLEQARNYRNQEDYHQAVNELSNALKLAPDWYWLYDNLCQIGVE